MIYVFDIAGEIRGDVLGALGASVGDVTASGGRSALRMDIIDRSELAGAITHMIELGLDLVGMQRVG